MSAKREPKDLRSGLSPRCQSYLRDEGIRKQARRDEHDKCMKKKRLKGSVRRLEMEREVQAKVQQLVITECSRLMIHWGDLGTAAKIVVFEALDKSEPWANRDRLAAAKLVFETLARVAPGLLVEKDEVLRSAGELAREVIGAHRVVEKTGGEAN